MLVLKRTIFLMMAISLAGCFGGGNNIKESYYDIKISDGISSDEAKTTALYHARLDRRFDNVSADAVSAQILSQGNYWRVTLAQKAGRGVESATYLVNKINGNAKSIDESAAPVNFTANTGSKVVEDELSPREKSALSRHARLRELNKARNAPEKEHPNKKKEEAQKTEESVSDSRMVRAFPPRRPDGKVNDPSEEDNGATVNIDADSLVNILSSNNRIKAKSTPPANTNSRARPGGVTPEDLKAARSDKTVRKPKPRTGGDAARALQQADSTGKQATKDSATTPQQAAPKQTAQNKNARRDGNTTSNTSAQNRQASRRRSSTGNNGTEPKRFQRNIGPRFVDAFPSGGRQSTSGVSRTPGHTIGSNARRQLSQDTNQSMAVVNAQAPVDPEHPVYQLRLLNDGFEADLNNRIQLRPDHDMDFTETEDITTEIANEALAHNVNTDSNTGRTLTEPGETVNRIITESPASRINTNAIVGNSNVSNTGTITRADLEDAVLEPEPAAETQIASLGKPPSMAEPFFTTRGDTVTFKGAEAGNKAVLRLMDEFIRDGYRTRVVPVMINGTEIRDEARFYELPPGIYTIALRCFSIYDASTSDKRYSYETEVEISLVNNHEYVLEAQTYRFDNHVECASDIYDVRDAR